MMEHLTTYGFMAYDYSEGKVYLDTNFFASLDWVIQLDIPQDWIHSIESVRETIHEANYGEQND